MNEKRAKKLRKTIFGPGTEGYHSERTYVARRHEFYSKLVDIGNGQVLDLTPLTVYLTPNSTHWAYRRMKNILNKEGRIGR